MRLKDVLPMPAIRDLMCVGIHQNTDHIKSYIFLDAFEFDIRVTCRNHPFFLVLIHVFFRCLVAERGGAGLDFCKHNRMLVFRYQIYLQMAHAPVVFNNLEPFGFQHFSGFFLTDDSYGICNKSHIISVVLHVPHLTAAG